MQSIKHDSHRVHVYRENSVIAINRVNRYSFVFFLNKNRVMCWISIVHSFMSFVLIHFVLFLFWICLITYWRCGAADNVIVCTQSMIDCSLARSSPPFVRSSVSQSVALVSSCDTHRFMMCAWQRTTKEKKNT